MWDCPGITAPVASRVHVDTILFWPTSTAYCDLGALVARLIDDSINAMRMCMYTMYPCTIHAASL